MFKTKKKHIKTSTYLNLFGNNTYNKDKRVMVKF